MTVVELWNVFNSWTPFTNVTVFEYKTRQFHSFTYAEDVLNKYANCAVSSFDYNSATDLITIEV